MQVLPQEAPPSSLRKKARSLLRFAPRVGGILVSGILIAFLGAILPSWQHHLSSEYETVGLYFVGLIAGILASVWISPPLIEKKGIGWTLAFACGQLHPRCSI